MSLARTNSLVYGAVFVLICALVWLAGILLLRAVNLPGLSGISGIPALQLSYGFTPSVIERIGFMLQTQPLRSVVAAPGALMPNEGELRAKLVPSSGVALIALGLFILAQGWSWTALTTMNSYRLACIVGMAFVAGMLWIKERQGAALFTRADESGVTYQRYWQAPKHLSWEQIARVEELEMFRGRGNTPDTLYVFRDMAGRVLLTASPYSSSPEQRQQFVQVIGRYTGRSSI